ncbi:Histone-lysine N-methyltransferase SETD1 [Frankliniella fusca]|uniref:Histone-lysine N-methyltransferase SETD1 n=1 Tax=Frankliniella fusca TaxID=407009 RepID=A0AAE1HNG0_9NEOP|nr:Histone-lysine N-methyltransferase SETD1 [Frankliniella fusca]
MDVSRLHKDELLFELAYRGLDLKKEKKTVTELRALLSERIEREAAGEEFESLVTWEDVDEGLILFQTKVELLNELVRPAGGDFDPSSAGRTRALASHCNKRLIALMERYDEMSPEMRTDVKKQAILLKTLVSEFRSMGESRVYAASSVQSVSAVEGWEPPQRPAGVARGMVVGGGAVERKQAVRASVQPSRKSKKSSRKKSAISSSSASSSSSDSSDAEPVSRRTRLSSVPKDLHKWGVQPFSGDQSVSVCSFLSDIEEKARWRRVNLDSLVAAASEFFCGEAKVRYRSIAGSIDSWKEFCIKVKEEFLPMDYYDNLMEEIRSRKQGPEETVGTYVANMCALFDRLGTGVDEEHRQYEGWKLAITVKNLAPYYTDRLTLVKVASFEHLKQLGRDIEARGSFHELPPLQAKGGSLRACARRDRVRSPRKSKVLCEEVETIQVDVRGDGRLYVLVELYGVKFFGLLDSGATASTVGGGAWDKLRSYNKISVIGQDSWEKLCRSEVKLQPCRTKHVKVADGQTCPVLGCLDAPVLLDGKMKDIILGIDFWRTFGLLPDVVKGTCALAESELPVMEEIIIPKDKLSEEERTLLDQVVKAKENDIVPKVVIWNLANFANAEPALRVVHTVLLEVAEQIEAREDCTDLARKTASALLEVQHTGTSGYRGDEWLTESSRAVASILARVRSASSLRENRPHICSASVTAADLNVTDNLAVKGSHVEAWLSNYLRLHPTISFGLLEKAFRTAFAAKDDSRQLRALVKARTLKKGEGIREYFVDKLVLLSRYSREMRLADQIAYMKEGLPVSFQKLLIGMSFKSMEEMLDFLVDAEADVADLQERNILPGGSVEKNVSIQESPLTAIEGPTGRVEKLEEAFQALLLAVTEIKGHLGERNSRSRANSRDRRWDRPRSREVSRGNYRGRDQTPGRPRDRSYSRDRESSYDRSRYRRDRSPDRSRRDYSRDSRRDYSRDSRRDYSRDSRRDRSRDYSRDAQKDHSRGAPDRERSRDRDKDSLFRCFSLALYGYQNDFWDVKKQINRHILKNWENFVGLLVDFKGTYFASRSKYMKHTKHQGSVGELPHIIAASEIFDCPVTVVEGKDYTYVGQGRQGKEIVLQTTILNHRPHYDLLECRKFPVRSDFSYAMALGDEPVPDTAKVTPTPVNFTSPNSFGFRTMPPPHTQTTSFPAQTGEGAKPHPSQEKQKNTNTREWHTVTHKSKQHNLNSIMQQINFTTPLQNKFQLLNEHCPADKDIKVTCVKKGSEVCTKIKIIPHKQKPKTHKNQKGSGDILRLTDKGIKDQEILTLHSPRWTSKEHDEEGNGGDEHNIVALLPVTIKTAKVEGLLDTGAVGISYDIILGNNFLKNAKAVLDYGAMLVTLSQKKERLRFRFGVPFRAIKSTTWDCPFQNLNVAELEPLNG